MPLTVQWIEPGPYDYVLVQSVTVEEAISEQKALAARTHYVYANDEQALDDFVLVHWAVIVEENEE